MYTVCKWIYSRRQYFGELYVARFIQWVILPTNRQNGDIYG